MVKKIKPVLGEKFGRLTVAEEAGQTKFKKTLVKCICDCGTEVIVVYAGLKNGHTTSCGCYKKDLNTEIFAKDFTGQRSGRLVMLEYTRNENGRRLWKCQCDCGNIIEAIGGNVSSGHTLSCGCLQIDNTKKANTTHGMSNSSEYFTYNTMIARCYNPNSAKYYLYGERGVKVSDRWLESFDNFYNDMGKRPDGMSLERIDVNGNYCKENCKWDTRTEQAFNKRINPLNSSGVTGVTQIGRKWRAYISKNNVQYNLGYFSTFEEAVEARKKAELEHYGYLKEEKCE